MSTARTLLIPAGPQLLVQRGPTTTRTGMLTAVACDTAAQRRSAVAKLLTRIAPGHTAGIRLLLNYY